VSEPPRWFEGPRTADRDDDFESSRLGRIRIKGRQKTRESAMLVAVVCEYATERPGHGGVGWLFQIMHLTDEHFDKRTTKRDADRRPSNFKSPMRPNIASSS
jgi:hypothetical protein